MCSDSTQDIEVLFKNLIFTLKIEFKWVGKHALCARRFWALYMSHLSQPSPVQSTGDHQVKSSLAGKQASYLPILIQVLPPQCPVHFWFDRLFSLFWDSTFFRHDHYLLFFLTGEGTTSHTWVPPLTLTKLPGEGSAAAAPGSRTRRSTIRRARDSHLRHQTRSAHVTLH